MYQGRDKQRRLRRLRRSLTAATVIVGVAVVSYLLFFTSGSFSFDNALSDHFTTAPEAEDSILTYAGPLDTLHKPAKQIRVIKSAPIAKDSTFPSNVTVSPNVTVAQNEKKPVIKPEEPVKFSPEKAAGNKINTSAKDKENAAAPAYEVVSQAHFYNKPSERARRKEAISYWNVSYASIKPIEEKNGFIYVKFKYPLGRTSTGWLRKRDLKEVSTAYQNTKE